MAANIGIRFLEWELLVSTVSIANKISSSRLVGQWIARSLSNLIVSEISLKQKTSQAGQQVVTQTDRVD